MANEELVTVTVNDVFEMNVPRALVPEPRCRHHRRRR